MLVMVGFGNLLKSFGRDFVIVNLIPDGHGWNEGKTLPSSESPTPMQLQQGYSLLQLLPLPYGTRCSGEWKL